MRSIVGGFGTGAGSDLEAQIFKATRLEPAYQIRRYKHFPKIDNFV